MCYTQSMTENMNEQKDTSMRRNSGYRLRKWLLGSIAALKKATVAIPEGAVAGPEGAVNTSGAQASGKNAERSYEVVAVIPIELFTSHNLDTVRRSIQNNKMVCCEDLTGPESKDSEDLAGRNKIGRYIQQFSAYDYKIYQVKNSGLHSQIMCKCNEVLDQEFKIKKDHIEVLLAFPAKNKKSQTEGSGVEPEDSAEMFENTSITISIIVSIDDSKIGKDSNEKEKAEKLKAIGDTLKELVGENAKKNINTILNTDGDSEIRKIIDILGDEFAEEVKDSDDNHNTKKNSENRIQRLDEMIEVNYVFTYFICYEFEYHIVVDKILNVDDNIKYSGDAWFLKLSTVGLYKSLEDKYISENYYNELCKKYEQEQNNSNQGKTSNPSDLYEKVSDTHEWLVNELIPESQIRPRDIFYIPKINGREDYTSVILKYANRFCCFVKDSKENSRRSDSDDGNRVIGMQIVLQSFWHRMTEFSRVLHQTSQIEKCKLETDTKIRFMNQVHTTPTVAEQIVDVNSDDVDVGTLLDLAQATKIDSAAKIFNESKQTYLAIDAHEQTKERRQATEKANRGLQSMFLALALLTYALGLTELWGEWATISNSWKATITILFPVILAVFYFGFNYWERLRGFFKGDRRKKSVQ